MASFINFEQTGRFRPSLWSVPAVTPNKTALHLIVAQHRCQDNYYQPQNPLESGVQGVQGQAHLALM